MLRNDDDIKLHTSLDDLTVDEDARDIITQELTDDPTEVLGVDPDEFKAELDKYDDDKTDDDNEDRRNDIEAIDGGESERS